jgi:O-antigen/teichoic acid export membrane protein
MGPSSASEPIVAKKYRHSKSGRTISLPSIGETIKHTVQLLEGPIVRNAASLYGTTIITSGLGFFYWFVAAHMVDTAAVGTASAVISAAQFLALVCVLGLSTLLISELSVDKTHARSLILSAGSGAAIFSFAISAIVAICLGVTATTLRAGLTGPTKISIFIVLGVLSTVLLIMDDACIGLLKGNLQMRRNTVCAIVKLASLPLLILVWPERTGAELVVAWVLGLAASLVTVLYGLGKLTRGTTSRIDFRQLYEKRKLMVGHHWLNLSVQSPRLIIPVLVATIVGPSANAAFTAALLVVTFVNIIPVHLSTVLFALAPGDEVSLRLEVRKTMRICVILSLASAPFFILFSRPILGLFGHHYEIAAPALAIMGFTTYPLAIKSHYAAIARVRGQMQQAAFRTMIGAILEVGLSAIGGALYGVTGVGAGYLLGTVIEALIFSPVVFGVLRASPSTEKKRQHR